MENVQRVSVSVDLHPEDYRQLAEAAQRAKMSEPEFFALAIHRGVVELSAVPGEAWLVGKRKHR